jgi:hypothetical protein
MGFGYDFSWWGSILGSVYFNHVFGEIEVPLPTGGITHKLSTNQTSIGTGLGAVGLVIGAMVSMMGSFISTGQILTYGPLDRFLLQREVWS